MNEDLAVSKLSRSLKQSKEKELEQVKMIADESMAELAASLKTSLTAELSSIEDDMTKRLTTLRNKMSEARQTIIKDENETLKTLRTNRKEIESEALSLMQSVNKVKMRYWIVPLIVALSIILGLVMGMWGLGVAISGRTQALTQLNEDIAKAKASREKIGSYTLVAKTYKNGIEVKKKPDVWQEENGNWIVLFKKGK